MLSFEDKAAVNAWGLPEYFTTSIDLYFGYPNGVGSGYRQQISGYGEKIYKTAELTMLPVYNDQGGVTVTIYDWAAINANTKRPDDAFFVLDVLLSQQGVEQLSYYSIIASNNTPVYEGVFSKEFAKNYEEVHKLDYARAKKSMNTVSSLYNLNWYMSDENYAEFCRVREQITDAQFDSSINRELNSFYAAYASGEGSFEDLVHQAYRTMKQKLSE